MRSSIWCSAAVLIALSAVGLTGCGGTDKVSGKDPKKSEEGGHSHPTEGPHGGLLVEIGKEEYHVEVCHDHKTNAVTAYVLDSSAKKPVPIADKQITINLVADGKPAQFNLPAKPLEGEPAGQSSRFELVDQTLAEKHDAETAKARVKLTIGGKEYNGPIERHVH